MTLNYEDAWKKVEGTAVSMCQKYYIHGYEWQDMLQEARMELWDTLNFYDDSKGVKLNTFYYSRLRNRFTKILQATLAQKNYYNISEYSKLDDENIERFIPSDIVDPETALINDETTQEWFERFDNLHPHLRHIIDLRMRGYRQQDIADELGQSIGTVNGRFKLLRQFFKSEPSVDEIKSFNDEFQKTLDRGGL